MHSIDIYTSILFYYYFYSILFYRIYCLSYHKMMGFYNLLIRLFTTLSILKGVLSANHHRHGSKKMSNKQILLAQNGFNKARPIPDNLKKFYDKVKAGECKGDNLLAKGFVGEGSKVGSTYCTNDKKDIVYLSNKPGKLANMDVDCDGDQRDPGDGRCGSSTDTEGQTTFIDTVQNYGVKDLNANYIPYVVFGNDQSKNFWPEKFGIKPLSVMAVVCNNKLVYGVWGDTCGDSIPHVGEASLSLATACYGTSMNGNNGHDEPDVLYIGFKGKQAVPGKKAKWNAKSFQEFEDSIAAIGDKLVQKIQP